MYQQFEDYFIASSIGLLICLLLVWVCLALNWLYDAIVNGVDWREIFSSIKEWLLPLIAVPIVFVALILFWPFLAAHMIATEVTEHWRKK